MHLSPQQRHILQWIVDQDGTAERIAIHFGVGTGAINTQLDRMRKKLGVHTRAAIVAKAWQAWMEMEEFR